MAETTVVHLLRHGEVHNPDDVLYGRLPGYHLSANGRMMAAAAADFFDGRPVAAVFASPLERAQETAQPVAERLGLQIVTDDRLIESANVLEGKTVSLGQPRGEPGELAVPVEPVPAVVGRAVHRGRRPGCGRSSTGRGKPPAARRRSASATSCRSGSAASPPSTGGCGTTRTRRQCALGSVTSFTFDGDELTGVSYAVPPRRQVADPDRAQ